MSPDGAVAFTPLAPPRSTAASAAGYAAGYSAGWAAGLRAAARDAEAQRARVAEEARAADAARDAAARAAVDVLTRAAEAARARTAPVLADAEAALVAGALDLAEALLGAELHDGGASARAAVRRALATGGEDVVRIRLHPADLAALPTALPDGGRELPAGVDLVADASLARGDAVSELAEGYLDARLGTALARVRAALGAGS